MADIRWDLRARMTRLFKEASSPFFARLLSGPGSLFGLG